jgi:hypothetical protein
VTRRRRSGVLKWPSSAGEDSALPQSVFLRGLSMGALIGAAIAGSALWERRRRRPTAADPEASGTGGGAAEVVAGG